MTRKHVLGPSEFPTSSDRIAPWSCVPLRSRGGFLPGRAHGRARASSAQTRQAGAVMENAAAGQPAYAALGLTVGHALEDSSQGRAAGRRQPVEIAPCVWFVTRPYYEKNMPFPWGFRGVRGSNWARERTVTQTGNDIQRAVSGVKTKAPKGVLNPLPDRSTARAKQTVSYPAPSWSGA